MKFRKKIYYPDTQITKNLYTRGKEWVYLDNWEEYVGFYHKYSTGEVYTDKIWNPVKSRQLVAYKDKDNDYFRYLDIKQYIVLPNKKVERQGGGGLNKYYDYTPPVVVRIMPTGDEISYGAMKRYFNYKRNEYNRVFFEIDEKQSKEYEKGGGEGINQFLYGLLVIDWKIDGDEFDTFDDNGILLSPGVVDTNRRIVLRNSEKFPILATILRDYREFSKYAGFT